MPIHFTDIAIRSLKPGVYFDDATPAFGIRIGKNRKTWLVLKQPNRTKVRLGHYPALPLAKARQKALVALGSPLSPPPAPGFPEALDDFLAQDRWKPRSKYEIDRILRRHFTWTKTLDKITHNDIATVVDGIEAKHEAAHALKDIKTFFNWCVPRYLPNSPCNGLNPPARYTPRTRILTDDEIKKIWNAAKAMGTYGSQVQLLLATGQRANQIISLKREWIDEKKRTILFPASIMKGNRDHLIPYGDLSAPLLKAHQPSSYQGKKKKELDILSGVTGYTLHDFRRYYSSTQRKLKTPIDITEAILSHLSGSRSQIQRIYDLYDRLDEMRAAILRYENWIKSLVG